MVVGIELSPNVSVFRDLCFLTSKRVCASYQLAIKNTKELIADLNTKDDHSL